MVNPVGLPFQPILFVPVQPVAPVTAPLDDVDAGRRAPPAAAPTPDLAAQVVATATASAAARQGGLGPLMADLAQAADTPDLPAPVRAAAAEVLKLQTPLAGDIAAPQVRQAVRQSGLFLEARLAAAPTAPPGPDLKAALLVLRQVLSGLDQPIPPSGRAPAQAPPPPYRGAPTHAQRPAAPTLPPGSGASAVTSRLLQETSAALARGELLQLASRPEAERAVAPLPDAPQTARSEPTRWMVEVPFATPQGPAVAQFEISRDGQPAGGPIVAEPVWRVRFSLDLEPLGPVHAAVSMAAGQVNATLWAERPQSAAALRGRMTELSEALQPVADRAEVSVYPGAPPYHAPSPGRLVDQAT